MNAILSIQAKKVRNLYSNNREAAEACAMMEKHVKAALAPFGITWAADATKLMATNLVLSQEVEAMHTKGRQLRLTLRANGSGVTATATSDFTPQEINGRKVKNFSR